MVYAFECERCQIRVYSAKPKRTRGCPLCAQPMDGAPLVQRGGEKVSAPALRVEMPPPGSRTA